MKMNYSDEEINELINEIEENYMLNAPPNLKNDILDRIREDEIKNKKRKDNVTLTFYSIKVGVTVAAAIAVLLITPYSESSNYKNTSKFTEGLGIFTSKIEKCIKIITPSKDMFRLDYKEK